MNLFYIGDKPQYIQVDYALSNRSKCRGCGKNIDKETLRIGYTINQDHYHSQLWHHLECFTLKPRFQDMDPQQQVCGYDKLDGGDDYDNILNKLKSEIQRIKQGKRPNKKRKTEKVQQKDSQKIQQKSKQKVKRKKSKKKQSSDSQEQQQQEQQPKKKKKAKKVTKIKQQKGLTQAQLQQFKIYRNDYMEKTVEQLKNILTLNLQPKTGTKAQIIQKCADGKLLGQIPPCPKCGGGKLRFNRETGIYKCPGYMEDTDFINCHAQFEMNQIQRNPWIEP